MKKYSISVLISLLLGLIIVSIINYCVDPFYHYHKPYFDMQPWLYNQRYQNPGYAKHGDYDSLVLGSSMTENFRASEFDKAFECSTAKLSYSAMSMGEFAITCDKAFSNHDVKNIFWGLDIYYIIKPHDWYCYDIPQYLYDDNAYNDVKYLLNKSVLLDNTYHYIRNNLNHNVPNIDDAYIWYQQCEFSKEAVLEEIEWNMLEYSLELSQYETEYLENAKSNLDKNILPYIENNPETQFYIFYPPYSILAWNRRLHNGDLEAACKTLKYVSERLLQYDNVKLYSFIDVKDVITNLDNYKDYTHYSEKINSEMIRWMKEDKYRLDKDNYEQRIADFEKYVKEFDYSIWVTE